MWKWKRTEKKKAPHKVMDGDLSQLAARKGYGNYLLLREDETLARISIGRSGRANGEYLSHVRYGLAPQRNLEALR